MLVAVTAKTSVGATPVVARTSRVHAVILRQLSAVSKSNAPGQPATG
jgi:hypothetical protein